jgi:hypothetical protein
MQKKSFSECNIRTFERSDWTVEQGRCSYLRADTKTGRNSSNWMAEWSGTDECSDWTVEQCRCSYWRAETKTGRISSNWMAEWNQTNVLI